MILRNGLNKTVAPGLRAGRGWMCSARYMASEAVVKEAPRRASSICAIHTPALQCIPIMAPGEYTFTKHAHEAIKERAIFIEWIERTLANPELVLPDPDDDAVERRYRKIPEFGGRVLRVAVNVTVEPNRVVSVFFDRTMKDKL